jgi:hypothetical protein
MAVVFDRDFARVWSDGATPYIFSTVMRVPGLGELDELANKHIEMIRELKRTFGEVYSVLDLRLCPPVPESVVRHYITKILPRQFKTGLKHKALVLPEEKKSQDLLFNAMKLMEGMPVSIHSTFSKALNEVNRKRTERTPPELKSIFGFLGSLGR